MSHKAY